MGAGWSFLGVDGWGNFMASNAEGQKDKGVFHVRITFLLLLLQQVNSGSFLGGGVRQSPGVIGDWMVRVFSGQVIF